jgi:hypothetical protein
MRRVLVPILLACSAGCSNAPIAGFLDCVAPSRGGTDRPRTDSGPVVPDVRPRTPGGQPDALPPPVDVGPAR